MTAKELHIEIMIEMHGQDQNQTHLKVLAIDGDPVMLKLISKYLGPQYEVLVAHSGPEGLQILSTRGPFALVIADMVMSEMNGIEVLTRAHALAPQAIRMMLTANKDRETADQALENGGVFHYLVKPFNAEDLRSSVRLCFELFELRERMTCLGMNLAG